MPLPLSRNTTYATNTPVEPNDLNEFQDYLIALYLGTFPHVEEPISLHASAFHAAGNNSVTSPSNVSSGGIPGAAWQSWGAAPNNAIVAGLHLRSGDRIKTITWFYNKSGNSSGMAFKLAVNSDGTPSEGGVADSDFTSSTGVVSKTTTIDHPVADNEAISLRVEATVASQEFYGCKIVYDRP